MQFLCFLSLHATNVLLRPERREVGGGVRGSGFRISSSVAHVFHVLAYPEIDPASLFSSCAVNACMIDQSSRQDFEVVVAMMASWRDRDRSLITEFDMVDAAYTYSATVRVVDAIANRFPVCSRNLFISLGVSC